MGVRFLHLKISGKNFFTMPTLEERFPSGIFPFFLGGSFFKMKIFRKKFFDDAYFIGKNNKVTFLSRKFPEKFLQTTVRPI